MTQNRLAPTQEYLKQIVFGGNDGIVTTFAIVAGFQGASAEGAAEIGSLAVLVFGFANLFADAVSMGLGEFLSGRSERKLYANEFAAELARNESSADADGLQERLQDRGVTGPDLNTALGLFRRHPRLLTELNLSWRDGMPEPDQGNLRTRALMTFLAFVVFGFIPILPYMLFPASGTTFILAVIATLLSLASLGVLRWTATGESLGRCVAETVLVGSICAAVAFGVGALVGGLG